MKIEELKQEITEYIDDEERHEALKKAKAECWKRLEARKHKIAEYFVNNQVSSIEMDGNTVKASFAQKFNVLGGKTTPEKRLLVLRNLVELGYLEEDKVTEHRALEFVAENTLTEVDAAEVHEGSLQAALRKVPYDTMQGWVDEKLISISPEPTVSIKASKKATTAA